MTGDDIRVSKSSAEDAMICDDEPLPHTRVAGMDKDKREEALAQFALIDASFSPSFSLPVR